MTKIKVKVDKMSEIRIKKGLSFRELSMISSVKHSTLSKIEKGTTAPTPKNAKLILDALCVEFDEVFEIFKEEKGINK